MDTKTTKQRRYNNKVGSETRVCGALSTTSVAARIYFSF